MNIKVALDETTGVDSLDPSGEIVITDGRSFISEKHAYLDSWLNALIEGLKEVESGKTASIDLVEEPYPLIFEPTNGGIRITYQGTALSLERIKEFREALRSAAQQFLNQAEAAGQAPESELITSIRQFSMHV